MSENQSPINKLLNRQKFDIFTSEGGPAIYKMIKGTEEFYFDSTDWTEHQAEFDGMGENGWILVEREKTLPPYLRSRLRALEEFGLVPFEWGYVKGKNKNIDLILNAINESIGQLTTEQRTKARLAGQTTIRVRITLSELTKLVTERLEGLHSADVILPSSVELLNYWLPMIANPLGGLIDSDGIIELNVEVPPPRQMHAR